MLPEFAGGPNPHGDLGLQQHPIANEMLREAGCEHIDGPRISPKDVD